MKIADRIFLLLLLLFTALFLSSCGCSASDDKVEKSGTADLSSSATSEIFTTSQQMNSKGDNGNSDEVNKENNSSVNSNSENNSVKEKSTVSTQSKNTVSQAETGEENAVRGDLNSEKTTSSAKSRDKTQTAPSEEQREDNAQVNFYDLL
ncbi:MAG: hypothetical protein PUE67_03955 [Oscillospiraceae bacterium]|nr:hypothetical protein [Oscillospiraceae bacterium]